MKGIHKDKGNLRKAILSPMTMINPWSSGTFRRTNLKDIMNFGYLWVVQRSVTSATAQRCLKSTPAKSKATLSASTAMATTRVKAARGSSQLIWINVLKISRQFLAQMNGKIIQMMASKNLRMLENR